MKQGSHIMLQRFVRSMSAPIRGRTSQSKTRVMQLLVSRARQCRVRGKRLQVLREIGCRSTSRLRSGRGGAVFHHQNLSVALNDSGLDLAMFFVHQNFVRQFAVKNLLADFRDTLRAQRIGEPASRSGGFDFS